MATFKGVISAALPVASGVSSNGREWKRASYILVYDNSNAQYLKSILFDVMGDRIEQLNLQQGQEYEIEVDFSTREYNGKTYMSASCWKATPTQQAPAQLTPQPAYQQTQAPKDDMGGDLPF